MPSNAQVSEMTRIDAAINELRFDFIRRLEGYVDRLDGILDASIGADGQGIEEAAHISHRIAGVAGTFGYAELGRIAHFTETAITAFVSCDAGCPDNTALTEKIGTLADYAADVCGEFFRQSSGAQVG